MLGEISWRDREARELIDTWKPDLVYTSDDYAQEYVAKHYINQKLPFVFSGVNADPSVYCDEKWKIPCLLIREPRNGGLIPLKGG